MNRIQLLEAGQPKRRQTLEPRLPNRQTPIVPGQRYEHNFFVPLHYEANYAYPLLVWLHGPEDNHHQLKAVMPHISVRNYIGVAPAAPEADRSQDIWSASSLAQAVDRVDHCVRCADDRFNIARQRIFLAGFDQGGTMALRMALSAPERFAGAASIGGAFPVGNHPMSNLHRLRDLPLMIAHGRDSDVYGVDQVCEELRLFHVAGITLNLRQYPCGHDLTTQMLSDLDAWMMKIVTGVEMDCSSSVDRLSLDN